MTNTNNMYMWTNKGKTLLIDLDKVSFCIKEYSQVREDEIAPVVRLIVDGQLTTITKDEGAEDLFKELKDYYL